MFYYKVNYTVEGKDHAGYCSGTEANDGDYVVTTKELIVITTKRIRHKKSFNFTNDGCSGEYSSGYCIGFSQDFVASKVKQLESYNIGMLNKLCYYSSQANECIYGIYRPKEPSCTYFNYDIEIPDSNIKELAVYSEPSKINNIFSYSGSILSHLLKRIERIFEYNSPSPLTIMDNTRTTTKDMPECKHCSVDAVNKTFPSIISNIIMEYIM